MRFYTGVGSRKTPEAILAVMTKLAAALNGQQWRLRSGGAIGADSAFEKGASGNSDIYLAKDATNQAIRIAAKTHPAWHRCNNYVRQLHGRNVLQVLGTDLSTPSGMLICWTDGAQIVGGTGTAIRLAIKYGVPVRNLADKAVLNNAIEFIGES
jgi:hypothetical protein